MKNLKLAVFLGFFLLVPLLAFSAQIKLAWDPVNDERVAGYKIYYGTSSKNYTNFVNVGKSTSYTLTGLTEGKVYYIAATSYDSQSKESSFSSELVVNIPITDSDGDGLSDNDETSTYKTDPYKYDTDGDGIGDGEEVAKGTDPLTPNSMIITAGLASFSHNQTTVYLNTSFTKPVVIVGPPTYKDSSPGVVRISNISSSSFNIRFQEWKYLDGIHGTEKASYLVLNEGRYLPSDGSIWEAKTFVLSGTGTWARITFSKPFPSTPKVFLTVQTAEDATPVIVRARNVDPTGFEVALFHEEAIKASHGTEIVGYVAVWAPNDYGNINGTPYAIGGAIVNSSWIKAGSFSLMLQEEKSADLETTHRQELVNILVFGTNIFAQNVWFIDSDPASLRLK